ncbi:hypothetical protein LBMAG42_04450 [Deltaproteobacteria bacterium]|nr:hypothetical protein LBMAG42_04450 [Deltaproteobacteria bacterium]
MLFLLATAAFAEPVERPELPFKGAAGEDGAHTLYFNPALLNFDRDPVYAVYYDTADAVAGGGNALTFATTGSGVGVGVSYRDLVGSSAWWTLTSGVSLRLTDSLAAGSAIHWQLPNGGNDNFVSWDLGLAWRPTSWLGLGGAVLNLGSPAPDLGVVTRYDAGVALRPFGDALTLGVDYRADTPVSGAVVSSVEASLRVKAARGIWLRAWGDRALFPDAPVGFGGSLELHFADLAVGATARSDSAGAPAGAGGYVTSLEGTDQLFMPGRQIAEIDVSGSFPYQPQGSLFAAPQESYLSLLRRVDAASRDGRIKGILLRMDGMSLSLAQVEELRGIVKRARHNGKAVVAWLAGGASNGDYLLASACDKVYLHPAGGLDLVGISAEVQYFKGALDLVGVGAQYAQRAEYKSGPEPWTRSSSSDPAQEEMEALIDDLYDTLVSGIAEGRGRSTDEVMAIVDAGPYSAREALAGGLVDGLLYPDELMTELEGVFPADYHLAEAYGRETDESGWSPQRAVAVVVVDGPIADGETTSGGLLGGAATGAKTVVKALEEAAENRAIKAVVLRVDSPGGSAFASDEIWRGVERVKESGKPVVVSMGGYAASGGYYVAAGADAIWAEPSTITGSIGVYGGKYNAEGLFGKLGINTEITARGRNASMFSMSRPMDAVEFAALDRLIGETYAQFKDRVATGRGLQPEQVEDVARGRVWSGSRAKEKHLIDAYGGFFEALDDARLRAGMNPGSPYTLVVMDPWSGPTALPTQVASVGRMVRQALSPKLEVPREMADFWRLAALRDEHVFALLPYDLRIQ